LDVGQGGSQSHLQRSAPLHVAYKGSKQKQAEFLAGWPSFEQFKRIELKAFCHKDTGERCWLITIGSEPSFCRLYDDTSIYMGIDNKRVFRNRFYKAGTPLLA